MNRRGFLKTLGVVSAGLVLGPEALEAYERLTWKRTLFPGYTPDTVGNGDLVDMHGRRWVVRMVGNGAALMFSATEGHYGAL